jgi:hypothetical protein
MPWIQGKNMPNKICGMMNLVGYYHLQTREVRGETKMSRVLQTNKDVSWYAKNQFKLPDGSGVFGPQGKLVNPTIPKMVEAIQAGRNGATASKRRPATRRRTATKGSK